MDPIDSTPPALRILQRRLAARLDRLQRDGRTSVAAPATSPAATPARVRASRKALQQRLEALDETDPRFVERAADAFVESVLLDEFGEALTNDANFRQLILQVSRDMRGEAGTAERLRELCGELRSE